MNPLTSPCPSIELGVHLGPVLKWLDPSRAQGPDAARLALLAEYGGADAITLPARFREAPRERDLVHAIAQNCACRLEIEIGPNPEEVDVACALRPQTVHLVNPDGSTDQALFRSAIERLGRAGICVSFVLLPELANVEESRALGLTALQLDTADYVRAPDAQAQRVEVARLGAAARLAVALGLKVSAGRGLDRENVRPLAHIIEIERFQIGHALAAQAILVGWEKAVREMKAVIIEERLATYGCRQ